VFFSEHSVYPVKYSNGNPTYIIHILWIYFSKSNNVWFVYVNTNLQFRSFVIKTVQVRIHTFETSATLSDGLLVVQHKHQLYHISTAVHAVNVT